MTAAEYYWFGGGGKGTQRKEKASMSSMPETVESKTSERHREGVISTSKLPKSILTP